MSKTYDGSNMVMAEIAFREALIASHQKRTGREAEHITHLQKMAIVAGFEEALALGATVDFTYILVHVANDPHDISLES
ncbi:Uncharacterised protein [Halioglobus japonicus]|nr:Uncharacterised protein [Halioglobus japonicus]